MAGWVEFGRETRWLGGKREGEIDVCNGKEGQRCITSERERERTSFITL